MESVYRQIRALREVPVDFISVTKGAGGSLRGGTLPIAQILKSQFGMCALAHFTCRDYTVEEVENALIDHHYFGIQNILALRGDPPDGQENWFKPAPNKHLYAYQLAKQIAEMNEGKYLTRSGFDTGAKSGSKTDFCIGAAAYPEHAPFEEGVEYFLKKVESGAQFAITQMLFSAEPYSRFLDALGAKGVSIPILPGIRILGQASAAERMRAKFGINVPQKLVDSLSSASSKEDAKKRGYEQAQKLCEDLLRAGAPGIHIFVMNDEISAAKLLREI